MSGQISIKKAAFLNAAAKYTTVILQLVYNAILSRILTPEDYGTVAVINVFLTFFLLIADMGFGVAIIQNKDLSKKEIGDIFSVTIYLGLLLMIGFMGFSYVISYVYKDEIYVSLSFILAIALAFNTFNVVPNAMLLKEKKFVAIALRTIIIAVISFALTIYFAIQGWGVYALVVYSLINAVGLFIWNLFSTRVKFYIRPQIGAIKKIWDYSMYQFLAQLLNFFNRNLDNLLVGKFLGKADLGYYNKSYTLMQYPITYLPGVITPVLHPILSEYQNDKRVIYEKYMSVLKLLSLLGCFVEAFCVFAGEEIIMIAFGEQWGNAVWPFKILALSLWMQILTNTVAPIYQSVGNTKLMFSSTVVASVSLILMIVVGVMTRDINSVALFVSCGYVINFIVTFYILIHKGLDMKFFEFLKNFRLHVIILGGLFLLMLVYPIIIPNVLVSFLVKFAVMVFVYIFLLILTKEHKCLIGFFKK